MKLFSGLADVVQLNPKGGASLGCGSFASVSLVSHRADPSRQFAMKEVDKKSPKATQMIYKEIKLHTSLIHPNIIRFEDYFETPDKVYIFLEFAKNGDMFGYMNKTKLPEEECLRLYYQVCEGIRYIHSKSIMHRDLKPENILIDEKLNVKIADFGWSAEYFPNENRQTLCGTYEYMAPEIFFKKPQTKKTDIWALGILLYELFHGHAPFRGNKMEEVLGNIMKNAIGFKKSLDPKVKSLISRILNFEPANRPTIEEVLTSDLIKGFLRKNPNLIVKTDLPTLDYLDQKGGAEEPKKKESVDGENKDPSQSLLAKFASVDLKGEKPEKGVLQPSEKENKL